MKNKLYYGDNLEVLRKHIRNETVDLCYIDPPFKSDRNYNQIYNNIGEDKALAQAFVDTWEWDNAANRGLVEIQGNYNGVFTEQSIELINGLEKILKRGSLLAYLVSMTLRIAEIHRVLKPTGSFYLHCDPTASHYLKLVLDAIFCSQGGDFKSEVIWKRTGAHNKVMRYAPVHDVIFFYTKSSSFCWNSFKIPYMKGHIETNFVKDDIGYRTKYYGNVLTGSGVRSGESGQVWKGFNPTAKNRHWAIPRALVEDLDEDISHLSQHQKLDRLYELGHITITEGQAWPMYHRYLNERDGQTISDIWAYQSYTDGTVFNTKLGIEEDVRWLSTKDKERLGYPTQKPEGLLGRIIKTSSNEGDLVLDAYCGCGTTIAVAEKLNRQWIGIDITYQSIALIINRLEKNFTKPDASALEGVEFNGIPKDFASAVALANKTDDKTRKEFEIWAVLTYTKNRAVINEKKGGDKGIDGIAFIVDKVNSNDKKTINNKVLFSVKSNQKLTPSVIRDLNGTIEREGAACGILLTLYPMPNLVKEAKTYGFYHNKFNGNDYQKIEVISIEGLLAGERIKLPNPLEVIQHAQQHINQQSLLE